MKKIKTINKLLSSLTLLTPLTSIGFNNQYQNTQKIITENDSALNGYFNLVGDQRLMGEITVNVDGTAITGYVSGDGTLIVDSDITIIGNNAFDHKTVSGVDLTHADSLTTIEDSAFLSTRKGLTGNLFIPKNLSTIADYAFMSTISWFDSISIDPANKNFSLCKNLGSNAQVLISGNTGTWTDETKVVSYLACGDLVFPQTITKIANSAFRQCLGIKTLNFSNATSLTTIGENAFKDCTNITGNLLIPSKVTSIGSWAFENDTIDNLYFLSETPPPSFDASWQPTVTGKVYVPSEEAKSKYTSAQNFGFIEEQIEVIGVSGKALINIDEKSAGSEQYTTIGGFSVTKWEIVMTEGEQPEWLSIDNQGILSWTDQNAAGTYKFKIKATNDLQESVESAPITFVVNESIPPEPTPEKSNIPLILGLLIGLGIPVILEIAFIIWYLTKKKKQTVKI